MGSFPPADEGPATLNDSGAAGRVPFGTPTRSRSDTTIPSWVIDEVLASATPVVRWLVVILHRHAWQATSAHGSRVLWWRGSFAELSRLTGASKPHLIAAEKYLSERDYLTIHTRTDVRKPHTISVPLDRPSGNKLLPLPEPNPALHGDDLDPLTDRRYEKIITTTTAEEAVTICDRLSAYGVTRPAAWMKAAGPARCTEALDYLESLDPARITNPAGFLYRLVHHAEAPPRPFARAAAVDSLEDRKAKYTGGLAARIRSGTQ